MTENVIEYKYRGNGTFEPAIQIEEYLYEILKNYGPLPRATLRRLTGIPRTTLYDALTRLILQGKIRKYPLHTRQCGRPRIYYEVLQEASP